MDKNKQPNTLKTDQQDITLREITIDDLPEAGRLFEDNLEHFASGGLAGLYAEAVRVAQSDDSKSEQYGVYNGDELVGYIKADPGNNPSEVEVSYGIDKRATKKGTALAALNAFTEWQNEAGKNVRADVDVRNIASQKVLEKAGFTTKRDMNEDGRIVYEKLSDDETAIAEKLRELGMYW